MPDRKPRRTVKSALRRGAGADRPAMRARRRAGRLVVVDAGNTETVLGVTQGREVLRYWRLTTRALTADEATLQARMLIDSAGLGPGATAGAVVCSVVPALTGAWVEALTRIAGTPAVEVGVGSARSMAIRYHDRSAVGADRLANAMAARTLYGTPAIVVDLGTATTFDCVSQQGAYLGGAIAPGVITSAEELFRRAARIPRVELRRPVRALGRTTEEALQAGVLWGAAGLVDALVRRLALEMKGTPHVIATGGIARVVAPDCETINRVDEELTLKGMVLIWEESQR